MALIKCKECGMGISDKAKSCPHCGCPLNEPEEKVESKDLIKDSGEEKNIKSYNKKTKLIVVAVAVIAVVFLIFSSIIKLSPTEEKKVAEISERIEKISDNTLTEPQIEEIEADYDKLNSKCKIHIKNKNVLKEAIKKIDERKVSVVTEKINKISDCEINGKIESDLNSAIGFYNDLTDKQKKMVKNYGTLQKVEKAYSEYKVELVVKNIDDIGTVSEESENKILTAKGLYDKLNDDEKKQIKNFNKLEEAEKEYESIIVNKCIEKINQIGTVSLESKEKIEEADKIYKSLDENNKKLVTNYEVLKNAKKTYETLKKEEEEKNMVLNNGDTITSNQWQVKFIGTNISATIKPNNTSGYYMYYYCDDDKTYLDFVFDVKNVSTDTLKLENIVSDVKATYYNSYRYTNYSLFYSNGSSIDTVYSWDSLNALNSTTLHLAIPIPREAQSNNAPIKAEFTIAGAKKVVNVR